MATSPKGQWSVTIAEPDAPSSAWAPNPWAANASATACSEFRKLVWPSAELPSLGEGLAEFDADLLGEFRGSLGSQFVEGSAEQTGNDLVVADGDVQTNERSRRREHLGRGDRRRRGRPVDTSR